jgi:hypothetical protein
MKWKDWNPKAAQDVDGHSQKTYENFGPIAKMLTKREVKKNAMRNLADWGWPKKPLNGDEDEHFVLSGQRTDDRYRRHSRAYVGHTTVCTTWGNKDKSKKVDRGSTTWGSRDITTKLSK